jgi:hypothetical protein
MNVWEREGGDKDWGPSPGCLFALWPILKIAVARILRWQ